MIIFLLDFYGKFISKKSLPKTNNNVINMVIPVVNGKDVNWDIKRGKNKK